MAITRWFVFSVLFILHLTRIQANSRRDGIPKIVTGEEITDLRALVALPESECEVIAGVTAYPGEVTGTACVVNTLDNVSEMRPGEVLVAPMTSPYHVPAMGIAAAVVTDEGGILSHAAIIARELRIPCIVGTKDATRRLRSGDSIRVRAVAMNGTIEPTEGLEKP